jgi:hypothetical protein
MSTIYNIILSPEFVWQLTYSMVFISDWLFSLNSSYSMKCFEPARCSLICQAQLRLWTVTSPTPVQRTPESVVPHLRMQYDPNQQLQSITSSRNILGITAEKPVMTTYINVWNKIFRCGEHTECSNLHVTS